MAVLGTLETEETLWLRGQWLRRLSSRTISGYTTSSHRVSGACLSIGLGKKGPFPSRVKKEVGTHVLLSGPLLLRQGGPYPGDRGSSRKTSEQTTSKLGCMMTAPICQESILEPQETTGADWVNLRPGIEGPPLPSSPPLPVLLDYLWFLRNRLRDDQLGVASLWTLTIVIYKADTQGLLCRVTKETKPNQTNKNNKEVMS